MDNTYDRDGNILTLKRYRYDAVIKDDFGYTYYPGTNKLKKVSTQFQDYIYDNNGNLKSDDMNKNFDITYDHRNLITHMKHLIYGMENEVYTQAIYYYYDKAGNRIRKLVFQSYIIEPEEVILENIELYPEYDEAIFDYEAKLYLQQTLGNPTAWFLVNNEFYIRGVDGKELILFKGTNLERYNMWGRDNEGYLDSADERYYYLKDHLGSVRVILGQNKSVVSATDYDMWGYLLEGRSFNLYKGKYKFTGKERDTESNYDYFGARYYDSKIVEVNSNENMGINSSNNYLDDIRTFYERKDGSFVNEDYITFVFNSDLEIVIRAESVKLEIKKI